jgi:hypothetical protein
MKNLITIIFALVITSCQVQSPIKVDGSEFENYNTEKTANAPRNKRVIIKEMNGYSSYEVSIIEVDGVEYLVSYKGGICPLVKPNEQTK